MFNASLSHASSMAPVASVATDSSPAWQPQHGASGNLAHISQVRSTQVMPPSQSGDGGLFDFFPLELFGIMCKYLNLPDQIAFANASPIYLRAKILSGFCQLATAEKKEQWVRYVINGDLQAAQFCMDSGVPGEVVNATDTSGFTALARAAVSGWREVVELLLLHLEIDVNLSSPLAEAAAKGELEIVNMLLMASGMNANALTIDDDSALSLATNNGQLAIVERLLLHPRIDPNLAIPIVAAACNGHAAIVKALLRESVIDVNKKNDHGSFALIEAVRNGHIEVVRILLEAGHMQVNLLDGDGDSALLCAISMGHAEIVKMLLAVDGIDINVKDVNNCSAFEYALFHKDLEIIEMLLQHPCLNPNQGAVLVEALSEEHTDVFFRLMRVPGIDVNAIDESGDSALGWAACHGYLEIVEVLLAHPRIDPNQGTPLVAAAMRGELDMLRRLLQAPHIDVNRKQEGGTALIHAARYGHIDCVRALMKEADIDATVIDDEGRPVLAVADTTIRSEIALLLANKPSRTESAEQASEMH